MVGCIRVTHPCAGRRQVILLSPSLPLDLHVLSLPLAFILSQDQTLHCIKCICLEPDCFLIPKRNLTDKYYILFSQNITSNSKNLLKNPPFFRTGTDCKDMSSFSILQIFFKNFLHFSENRMLHSPSNALASHFRTGSEHRCFSNADAKVGTFSESANNPRSFFAKNRIFLKITIFTYIYYIYNPTLPEKKRSEPDRNRLKSYLCTANRRPALPIHENQ